ncbi:hypothetical protein HK102_004839 [Quaeritorhiza haematococci]|nr:hypothetical protein HK102_004839 [Quaeritorhiza haematococci]
MVMDRWSARVNYILLVIWIMPLCTAIGAQLIVGYAPAGNWCWISNEPPRGPIARYTMTHSWRIIIFFTIVFTYSYVIIALNSRIRRSHNSSITGASGMSGTALKQAKAQRARDRKTRLAIAYLCLYPTAYILLWMGNMIQRAMEAAGTRSDAVSLISTSNQYLGFADATIYFFTMPIWFALKARIFGGSVGGSTAAASDQPASPNMAARRSADSFKSPA